MGGRLFRSACLLAAGAALALAALYLLYPQGVPLLRPSSVMDRLSAAVILGLAAVGFVWSSLRPTLWAKAFACLVASAWLGNGLFSLAFAPKLGVAPGFGALAAGSTVAVAALLMHRAAPAWPALVERLLSGWRSLNRD